MAYSSASTSSQLSTSNNSSNTQDPKVLANEALRRIKSLYDDIMTPYDYSDDDFNISYDVSHISPSATSAPYDYTRMISETLLCSKCRKSCEGTNSLRYYESPSRECFTSSPIGASNVRYDDGQYIDEDLRITIPQPFSFVEESMNRIKQRDLKLAERRKQLEEIEVKELGIKIHAKPVPKTTRMPLYKAMTSLGEKRKSERKEKCRSLLNSHEPFSLSYMSAKNKETASVDFMPFKAKPMPKDIVSEKVSEKLQNKEQLRKILIAHRAEETLKHSSYPFSQKTIPKSHSLCNISSKSKNNPKTKPNIKEITERLYNPKWRDKNPTTNPVSDKHVTYDSESKNRIYRSNSMRNICSEYSNSNTVQSNEDARIYSIKSKQTLDDWNNKVKQYSVNNDNTFIVESGKDKSYTNKSQLQPGATLPFHYFPVRMSNAAIQRERQIRSKISSEKSKETDVNSTNDALVEKRKEFQKSIISRLKDLDLAFSPQKEIEDRTKSLRASQLDRKQEYEKEVDEIIKRVSMQYLLIERQSKDKKARFDEQIGKSGSTESSASDDHASVAPESSEHLHSEHVSLSEQQNSEAMKSDNPSDENLQSEHSDKFSQSDQTNDLSDSDKEDQSELL